MGAPDKFLEYRKAVELAAAGTGRLCSFLMRLAARLVLHTRTGRVTVVKQRGVVDCGPAAVCMALAFHGHMVGLDLVSSLLELTERGSTAARIQALIVARGFRCRGISLDACDIAAVPAGSILHWHRCHFVVLEGAAFGHVGIVDPLIGRRLLTAADFADFFSGVALVIRPGGGKEKLCSDPDAAG